MRVFVETPDKGAVPVNMYAINLGYSGHGKGFATNIIEEHLTHKFRNNFLENTFNVIAMDHIRKLAVRKSIKRQTDEEDEIEKLTKEFNGLGPMLFSFDSATPAAIKQMRQKLLMANAGSINFECDEIGSNLLGQMDVLTTFLELFDIGKIKQKLVKNTSENLRSEEIEGKTPTNMMLYGTPSKLLNCSKTEEEFISLLETGYARRCFFGLSKKILAMKTLTPQEILDRYTNSSDDDELEDESNYFFALGSIHNFGKKILLSKPVALQLIQYRHNCEYLAQQLPEHKEIQRIELQHRYAKAIKLAGTYAFIQGSIEVTEELLDQAIKLTEESGAAFKEIFNREKPYEKLAKYIASENRELTHVDITEDLPFYKGSDSARKTMMDMAVAFGYRNNIIIKKSFHEGIDFFKGESLEKTNLAKIKVAYSTDITTNYKNDTCRFEDLYKLIQKNGYHWVNHHLTETAT